MKTIEKRILVPLIRTYHQIQGVRVILGNQVYSVIKDKILTIYPNEEIAPNMGLQSLLNLRVKKYPTCTAGPLETYYAELLATEKKIYKKLSRAVEGVPIYDQYLLGVKGIGGVFATTLIAMIDVHKTPAPSNLWSYCGLAVTKQGKAVAPKKGEKLNYNPLMKKTCYLIGESFIKCNSQYREYYDKKKAYYQAKEEKKHDLDKTSKQHIHRKALRYMVKRFLCDFLVHYRTLEGLPVSNPYVTEHIPGHDLEQPLVPLKK